MKSKASIKGHPLHPILVGFPIAFFTGTLVFDLLGWKYDTGFHQTAVYLTIAGLFTALLAAIPGIIDFTFTVPPRSSGKKRAAKHSVTNVTVLLIFGAALYYRLQTPSPSIGIILGLEATGIILLCIAGWMGGTLVYRNQIGVDLRYAGAGKWKEKYLEEKNGEVIVNDIASLQLNQMMLVHVAGKRIVISKTESGYAAFDDYCTHRGGSLAGGAIICGTVQCPWHGSHFDVITGDVKAGPATEKIVTYASQEKDGKLHVHI